MSFSVKCINMHKTLICNDNSMKWKVYFCQNLWIALNNFVNVSGILKHFWEKFDEILTQKKNWIFVKFLSLS